MLEKKILNMIKITGGLGMGLNQTGSHWKGQPTTHSHCISPEATL